MGILAPFPLEHFRPIERWQMKEYVMGNGAIALGALSAGVNLVAGYPGTPSSEIIETISKYPHEGIHLEWSVNEKAALEVAAAAADARRLPDSRLHAARLRPP